MRIRPNPVSSHNLKPFPRTIKYSGFRIRNARFSISKLPASGYSCSFCGLNDGQSQNKPVVKLERSAIGTSTTCAEASFRGLRTKNSPLEKELIVDNDAIDSGYASETQRNLPKQDRSDPPIQITGDRDDVYIALGSNVGDRFQAIESACKRIDEDDEMRILETSPLYETEPMYVQDQDWFLNGVCRIRTSLAPLALLNKLQAIENDLGRVKIIDKGPRNIDLDILLYGDTIMNTERLTLPHAGMLEREFVLRPLCDTKAKHFRHPTTKLVLHDHLSRWPKSSMPALTPLSPTLPLIRSTRRKHVTRIMAILNVTPDSFSDGGVHSPTNTEALKAAARAMIASGADIIDIGGQSSRPGAKSISAEEEIERVLPAIEAIKALPESEKIAISIDTYRAPVAEAAVNAGAHIVNDISAGALDPDMLSTVARLGCTYIMMHMRGTPESMQSAECTHYCKVFSDVTHELQQRLIAAQTAGIRRWRIILDPGIGFAKTARQNYELLDSWGHTTLGPLSTFPFLIGTSRKRFLLNTLQEAWEGRAGASGHGQNRLWGTEPQDRAFATAATVAHAVTKGAHIVRVHDVKEMFQVVRITESISRGLWLGSKKIERDMKDGEQNE